MEHILCGGADAFLPCRRQNPQLLSRNSQLALPPQTAAPHAYHIPRSCMPCANAPVLGRDVPWTRHGVPLIYTTSMLLSSGSPSSPKCNLGRAPAAAPSASAASPATPLQGSLPPAFACAPATLSRCLPAMQVGAGALPAQLPGRRQCNARLHGSSGSCGYGRRPPCWLPEEELQA